MLRGLTRESRHWGEFPEMLRQVSGDAAVLPIDLPGNGRRNRLASPTSVHAMAEYCRGQLRERGLPPPYFLLAMSLGAMVTVAWANDHPEEVGGSVLINTSLRPWNPFYQRLRPQNYLALLNLLLRSKEAIHREKIILRLTSSRPDRPQKLAEWADYAQQNPVSSGNALRQLLAALRFNAPHAKPPMPILILSSAQDRLVDPRCSRHLARHWGTAFAEHPTAGHDLPLDDGAWIARQVGHWLSTIVSQEK